MRVQRVVMPGSGLESWTVLGEGHVPVEPIERFLSYLASAERSPNTVKAYAHDLKDWFTFLTVHGLDGGRPRWRTSPAWWDGCGCHRPHATGRSACCPPSSITAAARA